MKYCYQTIKFRAEALTIIQKADEIMQEYIKDGFDLTLRQLYYQFVARGLLANNEKNYNKLGEIVSNGRLAGLLDWDAMVDRTREADEPGHWKDTAEIVEQCSRAFRLDSRSNQINYIEVWGEKEALAGIIRPAANRLDVTSLICRGFVSQSAAYEGYKRFRQADNRGQHCILIYLGDHDPSGLCMDDDIFSRLNWTFGVDVEVKRIALTMEQIDEFNPPPNPAKTTDSRFQKYADKFGNKSWELDALDPRTLDQLITEAVEKYTDLTKLTKRLKEQEKSRAQLRAISAKLQKDPKWRP